jgi:Tol biopolymer transport system component
MAYGLIAFTGPHSVIYTVNPDGSQLTEHANDPIAIAEYGPTFSPDSSKILFDGYQRGAVNGGANYDVYTMNADGSGIQNLTTSVADVASGFSQFNARWSPDGSRIVYDGDDGLYVMNANGSDQTRIAQGQDGSWSPDGTRLAFDGPGANVYAIFPDGSGLRQLTQSPVENIFPRWSPDGTQIAFVRGADHDYMLSAMNADGTNLTVVADLQTDGNVGAPVWSPDGTTIALDAFRNGTYDIYSVKVDGTRFTDLTNDTTADENDPVWSPDGSKLAFSKSSVLSTQADNTGSFEVYVMSPDGSDVQELMPGFLVGGFWLSWQTAPPATAALPTSPSQYAGSIDAAVGDGTDLWLVTCTERCGQDAGVPGAGTIQLLASHGDVVSTGCATPVDAIGALEHDGGDLFALGFAADTVTRLRADTGDVVWSTDLRGVDTQTPDPAFLPENVTVSADSVWVSSDRGGIAQLDRATGQLLQVLHLLPDATDDVAWSAGSLWVAEALAGLWRLAPDGHILAKVRLTGAQGTVLQVGSVVATTQGVWVTGGWAKPVVDAEGTSGYVATDTFVLALIDPATNTVAFSTDIPQGVGMTVIDDALWLVGGDGQTVYRADSSGITPISPDLKPGDRVLAITSAGVWIVDSDGVVSLQPLSPGSPPDVRPPAECTGGCWSQGPEGVWVKAVLANAGFALTGDTGSALVGRDETSEFYISTTPLGPPLAGLVDAGYSKVQEIDGHPVLGDGVRLVWEAEGRRVWVELGPRQDSQLPTGESLIRLFRATSSA